MSASARACFDRVRKNFQRRFRILLVDADAAFHRDRNRDGGLHRRDAIADQRRLRHQAGAEAAVLHAVGRTAGIEIDLVKAEIGADARARGERARIGAAELQRQRMLGRVVAQEPRPIAVQHRAGGQHFGIKQRAARQQAMEEPAMPVGPFHHRGDAETAVDIQCQDSEIQCQDSEDLWNWLLAHSSVTVHISDTPRHVPHMQVSYSHG